MSQVSKAPKCSDSQSAKKSSINNSSMVCEKYFKTFKLIPNQKLPTSEWAKDKPNTHLWKHENISTLEDFKIPKTKGIPCGKRNDIVVVDLDFYDKYDTDGKLKKAFDPANNHFINIFGGIEECKEIFKDHLVVETARGGLHLYFKYDPTIKTTSSEALGIDIKSDGGYVVGMGSQIDKSKYDGRLKGKTEEEKKGFYKVVNNKPIQRMPIELAIFLKNHMWRKRVITKPVKKNTNGKVEVVDDDAYDQDQIDLTAYNYDISDEELRKILDGLPDRYFINNNDWIIFSTAMMTLDRRDIWDEYSKKRGGDTYVEWQNNQKWDYQVFKYKTFMCIENLLCNSTYIVGNGDLEMNDKKKLATQYIAYYKYKPTDCHNYKPDVILEDRKYLDPENDGSFLTTEFSKMKCHNIVARSDTGTGKTTAFKNYVKKDEKRFISIVSRITLGEDQVRVFREDGIDCYWHDEITNPSDELLEEYSYIPYDFGWYCMEGQNVVVTIDSIIKMTNWKDFEDYTLYLDEFNSLVEYFIDCPNLDSKRIIVKEFLIKMLNECDRIIMTDADISDNSLLFLKQNGIDYTYIQNKYKHNKDIVAQELYSYEELIGNLKKLDKFMVCCDSKLSAIKVHSDLVDLGFDKDKMICITSDTKEAINLDNYDFVIFSPKIVYGLDSVMEREVFAFHKGHTISPHAMVQQIARCRNIKKLSFLFNGKNWKPYKYESVEECREAMEGGVDQFKTMGFRNATSDKKMEVNFNELLINFEYTKDCYETNKFAHFLNILRTRGFILKYKHMKSTGISNKISKKYKQEKINNFGDAMIKINEMRQELNDDMKCLELYMPCAWLNHIKLFNMTIDDINDNLEEFTPILTCEREVMYHFSKVRYFINDYNYVDGLDKKEDFDMKKYTSNDRQVIFLQKLIKLTDLDIHDPEFLMRKVIDPKEVEPLFKEYKNVFGRYRGKDNPFSYSKGVKRQIIKMYKDIFGKEIIETESTTKVNKKTGKTEKVYKYSISEEVLNITRKLNEIKEREPPEDELDVNWSDSSDDEDDFDYSHTAEDNQ